MRISGRTALAVSVIFLQIPSLAAHAQSAYPCWDAEEIQAARIKDFQTWMMVGALKCTDSYRNMTGNYNYFVVENRKTLGHYQDVLKAHFVRLHGQTEGQHVYDRFTTTLANTHSRDADASVSSFCTAVDRATQAAAAVAADAGSPDELEALIAVRPERAWYASANCIAPMAEAAPALPQTTAAAHDPALQPVSATGATASTAALPVQYPSQANSVAAAPEASQSVAAALQAAATALQSAAAALQMAQPTAPAQTHPDPP